METLHIVCKQGSDMCLECHALVKTRHTTFYCSLWVHDTTPNPRQIPWDVAALSAPLGFAPLLLRCILVLLLFIEGCLWHTGIDCYMLAV